MTDTKTIIDEVQRRVHELGVNDVPAMFSCIENANKPEEDMIMHVALFGDMHDCLFFMATIVQKILEKHISEEMLKELGMAKVRQLIFTQTEQVFLTIQRNKKYETVKSFDSKNKDEDVDNVPFVTQLIPKKEGNDKKPTPDE